MLIRLKSIVENPKFLQVITVIIILNSIVLGMKSYPSMMLKYGNILDVIDDLMIGIFVIELLLYLSVYGFKKCFTDPWYLFDAFVIVISIISFEPAFSALRSLRVLRVLRLVTIFPNLRKVVQGLIAAIPGIGSIVVLLAIVMYVASIMSTTLYGSDFPKYFGDMQSSLFSLFQIMTFESWASNIVRPVMDMYPYSWAFFLVFIWASSFIVLNLFIGVIVNAMQKDFDYQEGEDDKIESLHEIKALLKKIDKKI